jgi:uncharacterized repeat protein (TIGR01451 family)
MAFLSLNCIQSNDHTETKRKTNIKIILAILNLLIALLAIPSALGAVSSFPLDCSYQCSANDVEVTGAQISDQNGNDLPCRFCEPGNPASAYLALTVFNHAAAARYNIYIIYTLSINGVDQSRTFSCLAASIDGGQTIKAEIPIIWTCGQRMDLKNIVLTWSTVASENTCDIAKNCHPPGQSWCTPLMSVKTPLVAAFTSNSPQCICVPQSCQPIQFTSQITGGSGSYTYFWDLGDGSTSTQQNPTKQYSAPGIYQVTVTVSDGQCSDSHSGQVVVYPAPIAFFTTLPAIPAICLGSDLKFIDTSTPGIAAGIAPATIVKWEWDFGDGSAHSLDQNPVHHYTSAGNYQVTLKVTDSRGCTASVTSSVQVRANPVPTFTVDPSTLCFRPELSTAFHGQATSGSGPYTFAWDYGDGSTGSGSDTTHQYANQGTYNVKLTVTDNNGCTGTTTSPVTIVDCDPPGIDGVTVFTEPICSGLEQTIKAHVVDYVGVVSITLNYQVNGGAIIQKAMTFVAGSGSVKDGQWAVEVPGQAAGTTVTYWIAAYDGTFTAQSAHYTISFIDCTPPAITSVKASTFTPCAGSDVFITAHATAGPGVSSVTIDYDGSSHPMSGPAGSSSGDWTYEMPGSGKIAGDSLTFTISATDALGRTAHSSSFIVNWIDCTPPEIISVVPSDLSPCPPADVTVTAVITDDVAVTSAILTFEGADHPMSGPSPSDEWTATIPGSSRSAGDSVEYSVTAFDAAENSVTSEIFKITWRDCGAPDIESISLSKDDPCGGEDVTITAHITDNIAVASATIFINNNPIPMTGPVSGDWVYTITPGNAAGQSVSCYISAKDGEDNTATSATFTITWRDCIAPVIGSPVLVPASPCAGNDVFVKVHITDNVGVTSATISYDGLSHQMSGPIGPANNGDWTATIIGVGKKAGDSLSYSITATDAAENAATPATGTITWKDCTPPVVQSVEPSSSTPCAGTDVTITAHVTDDVGVAAVDLYYDSAHHAMSGPAGSKDGDWTLTIAGRPAGTSLSYTITASDGSNPSSPESGVILWKDCSNPDLNGPDIISITPSPETPCAGADVLITAHLKDDNGIASAELVYDGTSQPMSGVSGLQEEYWTANIPGTGRSAGSSVSYAVRALDTLGNPTISGEFTIIWMDCSHPDIDSIVLSPHEPCAGDDVNVNVLISDNVGVASATLTAGGTDYPMSGPTGSPSGEWTATIPGTGIPVGYTLTFSISATDAAGNKATPATGQIHWRDCATPEIQSVIASNSQPCTGEDVTVTARILDDSGVSSAILNFDSTSIPMAGPVGSASGDWTATLPGSAMQAGQTVSYSITAKDSFGIAAVSESQTISWQDCSLPQISEISPGNIEICEGDDDLQITARIEATAGIVSARIIYEEEGETGQYEVDMVRGGSDPNVWSGAISKSKVRTITYYITASTGKYTATSQSYRAIFDECDEPVLIDHEITTPCAGNEAQVSFTIRDNDQDFYRATITYEGKEYPLHLLGPDPYPLEGIWIGSIPGSGRQPEEMLSLSLNGYTLDTLGPNPPEGLGQFTVTWLDCRPDILSITPGTAAICTGKDQAISARATSAVGISSMVIHYTDSTGQYEAGMVIDAGADPKDASWTGLIPDHPVGSTVDYYIVATSSSGDIMRMPEVDSYSLTWIDCKPGDPVPTFTVDSQTLCFRPALSTSFHGRATQGSGTYISFQWEFGDGSTGSGPDPSHKYDNQGTYNVKLTVTDSLGSTGTTTAQVTIIDCDPPGIDDVTVFSEPICSDLEQVVNAHVVDYVGVTSVTLNYQVNGGAVTQKAMTFVAGSGSVKNGLWTVEVPGQAIGSTLTYWITANDGTFTAESSHYTISFIDCTPPAITSVTASTFTPCAGSDMLITAHATAGLGVSSVTIDYGGASYPMSGPAGSSSGDWTYSMPGTGKAVGDSLTFTVSAMDAKSRVVHSSSFTITWRDCEAPDIQSIIPSNSQPCAGEDVTITAHILDDHGVASATLNYDSSAIPMSGPMGSTSDDWTATIPGSARQAGESISYSITAIDSSGRTTVSGSGTISWQDCTPPQISEISPGDIETCEGGDLQITARITATAGVVFARIIYEDEGEAGLYKIEMIRVGDDPKDAVWSGTISGRKVRTINYYIIASTGKNTATSKSHRAIFDECDVPELIDHEITAPCVGNDAQVSFAIRDGDQDFYKAAIIYEGKEYPLHLQGPDPYPLEGIWTGSIPGSGRQPGETLSFSLNGYTLDTPGPNPPEGLGQFTVTWLDCRPGILSVTPGSTAVCTGNDQAISARATSAVGISSMMLHYIDSAGQSFETSMVMDAGADPKDASWTAFIPAYPEGSTVDYYIVATSSDGEVSRMPQIQDESYRLTWINCKAELNKTASASTVLPGGTITYTIAYQNKDSNTIYDVVIVESYPQGTNFISASPPPDEGTENRWTIGDLPPGASGTITIQVRAPDEAKIKFFMEQSASGMGFVRTYKDLNTGREPKVLTNQVSMTARGIAGQFAVSKVTISGEAGTKLAMRESGSGSYEREEELRYLKENRSIKDRSNLSASYQATEFLLPGTGSINYTSKWTDREKAKNYVTAESVEESYRYASKIQKESQIEMDRNGTNMTSDSQFVGMRHAGYFKASKPDEKGHVSPIIEMSSDYAGSFRVKERLGTTYNNRSNAITTVKHYEMPHITIYQKGERYNMSDPKIYYTISILNDGNQTLGPLYLTDLFPAGMMFSDASTNPSEEMPIDADHANWTFTSLPIGRSLTIYLTLMWYVVLEPPVNWVFVKAGHDGTWITANNSTLSNLNWLTSTPTGNPSGIQQKMITGDWSPPDWGFDQSPDICKSCTYSPPP